MDSNEVNALPDRVRNYIHNLEARCDPAGDVQELVCLRENCKALGAELAKLEAEAEALREILRRGQLCHRRDKPQWKYIFSIDVETEWQDTKDDAIGAAAKMIMEEQKLKDHAESQGEDLDRLCEQASGHFTADKPMPRKEPLTEAEIDMLVEDDISSEEESDGEIYT
jgi:uncharacterized coiled-coil DUF342 family protein